jgi:hypothetical protein
VRPVAPEQLTLMLVGLGDLGGVILELLTRQPWLERIVVGSVDADAAAARCNLAQLGAIAQGYEPTISFIPLDLRDTDRVAEVIHREHPDIVLSTASLQTWWLPDLLPPVKSQLIKGAGFGVWLPVHSLLTVKLMQALEKCVYDGLVLTAPFPDVANCMLARMGLAPTCGVGNLGEIVPKVRLLAARRLEAELEGVSVTLVAHHALQRYAMWQPEGDPPPYFLRVELDGEDVTEAVRADELLFAQFPVARGRVIHFLTAATTVNLLRALSLKERTFLHVPAPNGLPGGYPVWASSSGVDPCDIEGLPLGDAIAINERSHRYDGIESIEPDGTVVFRSESAAIFRDELGYDCERLAPDDIGARATELTTRFKEYGRKHGVEL